MRKDQTEGDQTERDQGKRNQRDGEKVHDESWKSTILKALWWGLARLLFLEFGEEMAKRKTGALQLFLFPFGWMVGRFQ